MTEIVPCRMCKGREDVKSPRRYQMNRQTWFGCGTLSCAVDGPRRHTEPEAIAAWNELMQPSAQASPEMQSKTVRVRIPVRVNHDDSIWIHYVDGDIRVGAHEWPVVAYVTADIPFPQPVEIHAECKEASDD